MAAKDESTSAILIVGSRYFLARGVEGLQEIYRVRVAETEDAALRYLNYMKFDLVVIENCVPQHIISAITEAIPAETLIHFVENLVRPDRLASHSQIPFSKDCRCSWLIDGS